MRFGALVVAAGLAGCDTVFGLRIVPDAPFELGGPVLHLPMDAITGCVTTDVVAALPATCDCAHCPAVTPGAIAGALAFDGTDRLEVRGGGGLETVDGFTVAAFVRPAQSPLGCPINKVAGTIENSWQICLTDAQIEFITSRAGNVPDLLAASVALTAEWHHLAVRYDGAQKSILFDGAEVATQAVADRPIFDGGAVELGADVDTGMPVDAFTGGLDDVRIYGRALDASEIAQLARR